jgi:hypothetical protein
MRGRSIHQTTTQYLIETYKHPSPAQRLTKTFTHLSPPQRGSLPNSHTWKRVGRMTFRRIVRRNAAGVLGWPRKLILLCIPLLEYAVVVALDAGVVFGEE